MKKSYINSRTTLLIRFVLLALIFVFISCSDDDGGMTDPDEEVNKTSGFVFAVSTSEGALVKYFENIPTGTIDLSDGKDFSRFLVEATHDHALFVRRPDRASGFSKMVVNAGGEVVEEGIIPTLDDNSFAMAIRDSETGVFQDLNTPKIITVFNPKTLDIITTINMSEGTNPEGVAPGYQRLIFRGDDVFAPIGGFDQTGHTSVILHQANVASGTFVGETEREGNGFSNISTFNTFGQNYVDEAGNLYIEDFGSLDGAGLAGRVNKIPAGSNEIDDTYIFEPAPIVNSDNVFLPGFGSFNYIGNGKAIAKVNATVPQPVIDIIESVNGVIGDLSDEQIDEVFDRLFSAESASWCELDLNALTVTPMAGMPQIGAFTTAIYFEHDGDYYIPILTEEENAYYKYSPATGQVGKAFDVTGGTILSAYNIANN